MPVEVLLDHPESTRAGFGFAMLALDCLLIDALQAFREGRTSGNEARTTQAFKEVLVNRPRFKSQFESRELAGKFVENIRNGLLHDGETRNGWRIWSHSPDGKMLENTEKGWVFYRNDFHAAIEQEFSDYVAQLVEPGTDSGMGSKFLLRMDSICGILREKKALLYFAYGSNRDRQQMAARVSGAVYIGIAHCGTTGLCLTSAAWMKRAKRTSRLMSKPVWVCGD